MRKEIVIKSGSVLAAMLIGVGVYSYTATQPTSAPHTPTPATTNTEPTTTTPIATSHTVAFRVLDTGTHAANTSERKNYAGYSEEGLAKIWKMSHGTDGTALPKIDFSKEYVIGVFAGQKPTGGYAIAVTAVTDTGTVRTVAVTLTSPGEGCMVTQALTNPYQLVVVPISTASLSPIDTEVAKPCN